MEFMHEQSKRFAIVVMDGMSEFDWGVLKESFAGIPYEESAVFAMIPTVTSVSRQSLLSGKYPKDLASPWTTAKERAEFTTCVRSWNVSDERIAYLRGYDADIPYGCDFAAFIIMDIDERAHGQYGGRAGMLRDMELLRNGKRLAGLVGRLIAKGLDVCPSKEARKGESRRNIHRDCASASLHYKQGSKSVTLSSRYCLPACRDPTLSPRARSLNMPRIRQTGPIVYCHPAIHVDNIAP